MTHSNSVFISLTYNCNQRCKFCYMAGTVGDKKITSFMTKEDFKKTIEWISEYYSPQTTMIRITGGEPTLHKDLIELIRMVDKKDYPVSLITNGARTQKLYDELKKFTHCLKVQFSIEGHNEKLHDFIVKKHGSFNRVVDSIKLFSKTFPINTNTTLNKFNQNEIFSIIKFLKNLEVSNIGLNYISPTKDNQNILCDFQTISDIYCKAKLLAEVLEVNLSTLMAIPLCVSKEGSGCAVGRGDVTIDPFLNIYPCPSMSFPDTRMGNIKISTIEEVFNSKIYKSMTESFDYLPKSCKECKYLKQCKGGCYLFWKLNLMNSYILKEENAIKNLEWR